MRFQRIVESAAAAGSMPPRTVVLWMDERYVLDGQPVAFFFRARIVAWIDADTVEVHPLLLAAGLNLRIRLKDVWAIEDEDDPVQHALVLAQAKAIIGDTGGLVHCKNYRHLLTYGRLEARVDGA